MEEWKNFELTEIQQTFLLYRRKNKTYQHKLNNEAKNRRQLFQTWVWSSDINLMIRVMLHNMNFTDWNSMIDSSRARIQILSAEPDSLTSRTAHVVTCRRVTGRSVWNADSLCASLRLGITHIVMLYRWCCLNPLRTTLKVTRCWKGFCRK